MKTKIDAIKNYDMDNKKAYCIRNLLGLIDSLTIQAFERICKKRKKRQVS